MPINKETIISVFDDKLTLMQWLKTINKALEDAVLTGVEITKKGNATLSFKFTFEDGTFLETNDIVLQQGESVNGAYIQNGHLYLTLTNGNNLDAGNVKPVSNFSIDANQHLIVNYQDGTSQDLGAIFNGNVVVGTIYQTNANWEADFSISSKTEGLELSNTAYKKLVQIGNVVWAIISGFLTNTSENNITNGYIGFNMYPNNAIASKLYRVDGTNCAQPYSTSEKVLWTNSNLDSEVSPTDVNSYSANQLVIYARNLNINAGQSKVLSIRIPLIITGE